MKYKLLHRLMYTGYFPYIIVSCSCIETMNTVYGIIAMVL